jgi:ABC-type multidrug transport system fused ATPase/permease subunit
MGLIALAAFDKAFWWSHQDTTMISLQIANGGIAVIRAVCCLLVPRRPDVYHQGKIVDQEHTASLWGRLTFGYITSFVRFTGRNQGIMAIEDFPQLPCQARSEHLHDVLQHAHLQGRSLFQAICKAHSRTLILQVTLALGSALFSFGPHIALYGILKGLEDSSMGSPGVWAAALGVTMCLASTLSSWVWWITYSKLAIPIASELLALLYAKSMRRKDVQQAKRAVDDTEQSSKSLQEQGHQEIINLVTVDTKRISDYASYNHLVPSSMAQFIIACAWLLVLIGWQSLLAGLAAIVLISPLNVWIAEEYRIFQKSMMQARDQRTSIVHEVVKNIRQIKFSAHEPAWQGRVLEARRHELRLLFQACFRETGFVAIWTLTPLLLSAVSLTVYALIYGHLAASVAFTAISIFGSLEVALAALPHLISTALEAKISVDRIDKYVGSPDKAPSQSNAADAVEFQDAVVTWPVPESSEDGIFCLSGLSLRFPPKGLGVVTGRTGSGKSLLLLSILGECDILSGSVQVPSGGQELGIVPPTSKDDWIIDSAIAYVAQNPWTENGTIKDNILFGLPFDRSRYQEVLFASGLERDLDILADGDQTDIGANGINLSGGQRLRVSFARALYSRAGILIMDDIFSALDADTSHHVYEYGLTGYLAQNRTRILATHHVGLCLPRTDYCVVLEDGSASCAGSVKELRKMDAFAHFLLASSTIDGHHRDDDHSQRSQSPNGRVLNEQDDDRKGQKFSPEEQRETGSVSLGVYKKLLTGDKSPWMWFLGVLASLLYTIFVFGRVSLPSLHPCMH